MTTRLRAGVLGATGMVGQRFITFLENHPWFEVTALGASPNSAGKNYRDAVAGRWKLTLPMPERVGKLPVFDAADVATISKQVDFVFCAVDMSKDEIKALEAAYATAETPVISNNSAHRHTLDVPMVVPEVNPEHIALIPVQRKRLGTTRGFIAVKPNCSIQSYVPALHALKEFGPELVVATTYQAISGSGKVFSDWPEILDNVIPFIKGEEEKSEHEPLRIWGTLENGQITNAALPLITAQCLRVPVSDGHLAACYVRFKVKPTRDQILDRWAAFKGVPQELKLPSAPARFITYKPEDDRPQSRLDRDVENGMGVTVGRLREDPAFDYKFVCLSHNTLRGAAGGAVLIAELLKAEGYLTAK